MEVCLPEDMGQILIQHGLLVWCTQCGPKLAEESKIIQCIRGAPHKGMQQRQRWRHQQHNTEHPQQTIALDNTNTTYSFTEHTNALKIQASIKAFITS